MDKDDDQVLQGEAFNSFPEEAVPLVIFNEEKKCKFILFYLNFEYILIGYRKTPFLRSRTQSKLFIFLVRVYGLYATVSQFF